ncbi:Cytochrome bd-II ubiquinol oxidase subunit 1 [Pseudoalteromonas holothuriae]|uniref:Cytochrome bd-II ubiquinol oxidase subunit 1 n=1 Tax=Pseudoalteromonas holothuriae TaxID=2963714 RepID=A0A9W4VV88_9GAMM|nr:MULTISPECIES: cytochrome ubiquinol oxidase subunit I [unclassified Pseudoalteromonas]CAH9065316.1 Cytochrome bd-II ubiquinol oxidase subunit 1 [Pseudoalteromonas sp. CIP111854]CAH9066424.1 Cytochrome bd-II ubiquinol oxidase subunit 1 [Pseudoalteromonas sp. CIP111951]
MLDTLLLSRIQFATNISFHILFPTITIALAWFLVFFKVKYDRTQHPVWLRAYRFWVKIFALTFALGVVSGITMSFQFGTNWPGFMEKVGNIAGPLLGYEVLTAFFMEATFLGVMLFGMKRVPPKIHTLATIVVAIGTSLSAFWILSLNSWMQTPTGFELRDGVVFPTDWFAVIFNPSFPYRLTHMLLASGLTAAFLIAGVSSYRLLKGDNKQAPQLTLKVSLTVAALLAPMQIFVGDLHGLNTFEHQPQKIAAMEGLWETQKGAPLILFAIPNEQTKSNDYEIEIPNMASLILTHKADGQIKGLNEFEDARPPVKPVFFGFRIMVGMGFLMITVAVYFRFTLWRKKSLASWQLKVLVAMSFSGWIATLAGWYVTEIGRQPFLVSGVLRIEDAVTQVASENVLISLIAYLTIYVLLLIAYIRTLFYTADKSVEVEEYQKPSIEENIYA